MYKITSPVKGYNGISAFVKFTEGVGLTSNQNSVDYFLSKGYKVEDLDSKEEVIDDAVLQANEVEDPDDEILVESDEEISVEDDEEDIVIISD